MIRAALAGLALLCGCSGPPDAAPRQRVPPPAASPRILHFYAYPAVIAKGQPAQICYGVESAGEARIDPRPGAVPAYANRCVEVTPERTTEYILTAAGRGGPGVSQRLTIEVSAVLKRAPAPVPVAPEGPARVRVAAFTANPRSVSPGGHVTICYETFEATSIRIEPPVVDFRLPARGCFAHAPTSTTTYRLTASGSGGSETRVAVVAVR